MDGGTEDHDPGSSAAQPPALPWAPPADEPQPPVGGPPWVPRGDTSAQSADQPAAASPPPAATQPGGPPWARQSAPTQQPNVPPAPGGGWAQQANVPPAPGTPWPQQPAAVPQQYAAQGAAAPGWYPTPDGTTAWWDGQRWMVAPPSPVAYVPYRPVAVAGALAQAALAAVAAFSLLLVWAQLRRRQAAKDFGASFDYAHALAVDRATALVGVISLGYLIAFVASAVAVPIFCNRVHHNLEGPLGARGLEYTPGWAAGWWFVPFANFVMPRRVVGEAWKASDPSYPRTTGQWRSNRVPGFVNLWWALFILAGLLGRFSYVSTDINGAASASSIETTATINALGSFCAVISAGLAVLVFRQITQRHTARAAALGIAER